MGEITKTLGDVFSAFDLQVSLLFPSSDVEATFNLPNPQRHGIAERVVLASGK